MSDSEEIEEQEDVLSELAALETQRRRNDMLVSGWDDADDLIEEDSDPHATPEREVLWAASENKFELVRQIIESHPECLHVVDRDGYTVLHKASYNNNDEMVRYLLMKGADPNARTEYNWTPLHSACKWNNGKCAAILLKHGSDINAVSNGDQTPLHITATVSNCRDMAVTLLMHSQLDPEILNNSHEKAADIAKRTGLSLPLFQMGHSAFRAQETAVLDF